MNHRALSRSLSRQVKHFVQDRQGASVVEFAMILPILLTFYLGTVEISQGIGIDRKVTLTARTAADLAAQVSSINNADMANLLSASSAVISPYDPAPLKVTVSLVSVDASGNAKVTWSDTLNGTKRAVGSSVSLPAALKVPNSALVWSEVSYAYKPTVGYVITGTLNLSDQIYMRPRLTDQITRVNS
jgi:Flp pilus assembly protein TadG